MSVLCGNRSSLPDAESLEHPNCESFIFENKMTSMGKVEFKISDIEVPHVGKLEIRGHFSRIKPALARQKLTKHEVATVMNEIRPWAMEVFKKVHEDDPVRFEKILEVSYLTVAFMYPIQEIGSKKFNLAVKEACYWWFMDDAIEHCLIFKTASPASLEKALTMLLDVMMDREPEFFEIEEVPLFRELFQCRVVLQKELMECNPNYKSKMVTIGDLWQNYNDAIRWYATRPIDGTYSEETFQIWRKMVAGPALGLEVFWVIENHHRIPQRIFRSASFLRFWDTINAVVSYSNDIFGMKKDFAEGHHFDSILLFKVLQKKIPLEEATRQVCAIISNNMSDYVCLRSSLLAEFPEEPVLRDYIEMADSYIDGHNRLYQLSRRYGAFEVKLLDS